MAIVDGRREAAASIIRISTTRGSIYERLRRVAAIDRDGALTAEAARYLALWMSYEDVIRVADLKTRPERFAKVRSRDVRRGPTSPCASPNS